MTSQQELSLSGMLLNLLSGIERGLFELKSVLGSGTESRIELTGLGEPQAAPGLRRTILA